MKSNGKGAAGGGRIVNSPITLAGVVTRQVRKRINGGHQDHALHTWQEPAQDLIADFDTQKKKDVKTQNIYSKQM